MTVLTRLNALMLLHKYRGSALILTGPQLLHRHLRQHWFTLSPHLHTLGDAAAQLRGPLRLPVVVADHLLLQVLQLQGDRVASGSSSR